MNGEAANDNDEKVVDDKIDTIGESEDTIVLSEDAADIDTVGDFTAELNVEKLVAKVEAGEVDAAEEEKEVHRRLLELEEERLREKELDSTYNFNIDEDL
jgi:hypothetical protein